jgi:hypothetical protein
MPSRRAVLTRPTVTWMPAVGPGSHSLCYFRAASVVCSPYGNDILCLTVQWSLLASTMNATWQFSAIFLFSSQLRRRDRSASKALDKHADCLRHRCEPPGRRIPFSYLEKAGPFKKARGPGEVNFTGAGGPVVISIQFRLAGSQREARQGPCRFCINLV